VGAIHASPEGYAGHGGSYVAPAVPNDDALANSYEHSHNISPIHQAFIDFIETRPADVCANIMICLVNQCDFLLDKQIAKLEQTFTETGGLRERMYNARKNYRQNN